MIKLVRTYVWLLSVISTKLATRQAFLLFQKTLKKSKRFRKRELPFYEKANQFRVFNSKEDLYCYEIGNPNNPLVVLVHGWDSNAGSMSSLADELVANGYYVITFDLPAHGKSALTHTNMIECSQALSDLLNRLLPSEPLTIVSHSLGSAVVSHALSSSPYRVNRWVALSSPNKVSDIFEEFKNLVGLNSKAFSEMKKLAKKIMNEPVEQVSVEQKILNMKLEKALFIHDEGDKVLPFKNSLAISNASERVELFATSKKGHYRMLTDEEIISRTLEFISIGEIKREESLVSAAMLN